MEKEFCFDKIFVIQHLPKSLVIFFLIGVIIGKFFGNKKIVPNMNIFFLLRVKYEKEKPIRFKSI